MAVSWFIETWGAVKVAYKMQVYYFCGVHSFREYINLKIRKAGCMIKKRIWSHIFLGSLYICKLEIHFILSA